MGENTSGEDRVSPEGGAGNNASGKPGRFPLLVGGLLGICAGTLAAWLLFDFAGPSGILILVGLAIGQLVATGFSCEFREDAVPRWLRTRRATPWPLLSRISSILFLIFISTGALLYSPRIPIAEDLRGGLFLLFGGLALLGGTPLLAAIESELRKLWAASFFIGMLLVAVGIMGALGFQADPMLKLALIIACGVAPLVILLVFLRKTLKTKKQHAESLDNHTPF